VAAIGHTDAANHQYDIHDFFDVGWRTIDIHQAILSGFGLAPESCTLTQLHYDLRKMKGHSLLERDGRRYAYRLTYKGTRAALLFVLFHQRVCGPMANSLFQRRPAQTHAPLSKIEPPTAKPTTPSTTSSNF
jgi:hypothetical protein